VDLQDVTHEITVYASPDDVWRAITDPEQTRLYWFGALNRSSWKPGERWTSESPEGELYLDGEIISVDAPRKLVHTFHVVHEPDAAAEAPSKMTFELAPVGRGTHLRVTHEGLGAAGMAYVTGGWEHILTGMKRFLESQPAVGATGI
jgi:uncharacterized protein YndB with AHSA1/START domain